MTTTFQSPWERWSKQRHFLNERDVDRRSTEIREGQISPSAGRITHGVKGAWSETTESCIRAIGSISALYPRE